MNLPTTAFVFLGLLTSTLAALGAESRSLDQVNLVAHVNLEKARASELWRAAESKLSEKIARARDGLRGKTGVSPEDVRDAWLFGFKRHSGAVALKGSFDCSAIRQAASDAGLKDLSLPGCLLAVQFEGRQGNLMMGALADSETLVLGDVSSVELALQSLRAGGLLPSLERMLGGGSGEAVEARLISMPEEARRINPMASSVKSARGQIRLESGVEVRIDVDAQSPESALAMEQILQGLVALAKASPPSANPIPRDIARSALAESCRISHDGARLHIAAGIDGNGLEALLKAAASMPCRMGCP